MLQWSIYFHYRFLECDLVWEHFLLWLCLSSVSPTSPPPLSPHRVQPHQALGHYKRRPNEIVFIHTTEHNLNPTSWQMKPLLPCQVCGGWSPGVVEHTCETSDTGGQSGTFQRGRSGTRWPVPPVVLWSLGVTDTQPYDEQVWQWPTGYWEAGVLCQRRATRATHTDILSSDRLNPEIPRFFSFSMIVLYLYLNVLFFLNTIKEINHSLFNIRQK